jgi:AcrR family transcriptional regulator
MTKLERSKSRRRDHIISAAIDLIRETGEAGISMRALASRANVSLATPYNLFGSKSVILVEVLKITASSFGEKFAAKASPNSLNRIFEFVDQSIGLYRSDPNFFKALLRALYKTEDTELRLLLQRPRIQFYKNLLRESIAEGYLSDDCSPEYHGRALHSIFGFAILDWVYGASSLEKARLEIDYGHSVILLDAATDTAKASIIERRKRYQATLTSRNWKMP